MGFAGMPAERCLKAKNSLIWSFDLIPLITMILRTLKRHCFTSRRKSTAVKSELVTISYTKGPAKISGQYQRRIAVGVNVRNRDLESVVKDVQKIIEEKVDLPVGYSVEYGGQFENYARHTVDNCRFNCLVVDFLFSFILPLIQ